MNERGFFSIVGLCLLLVITLSIMAIQVTEKNYSCLASDFQIETELRNAAESGLIDATKNIDILPKNLTLLTRDKQKKILTKTFNRNSKNIAVEVWGMRGVVDMYIRNYSAEDDVGRKAAYIDKPYQKNGSSERKGIILISVASCVDSLGLKRFRRIFAYILDDDEKKILHFMTVVERGDLKTN